LKRVELLHREVHDPKSCASASSATSPWVKVELYQTPDELIIYHETRLKTRKTSLRIYLL
jgi:hypothetical protein